MSSASVSGHALNIFEAENLDPADWWVGLEANPEDVADVSLSVTLTGAVAREQRKCYFTRFCPNYELPESRYAQGVRDPDDPALELERLRTVYGWARQRTSAMVAFARRNNIYWPMYGAFLAAAMATAVCTVLFAVRKLKQGYFCYRPMIGQGMAHWEPSY